MTKQWWSINRKVRICMYIIYLSNWNCILSFICSPTLILLGCLHSFFLISICDHKKSSTVLHFLQSTKRKVKTSDFYRHLKLFQIRKERERKKRLKEKEEELARREEEARKILEEANRVLSEESACELIMFKGIEYT